MTTTVAALEMIQEWLLEEVCPNVEYKKPNDEFQDGTYPYERVHPDVHIMYIPSRDISEIPHSIIPSICVQFEKRNDNAVESKGTMDFRLQFATWNPGRHVNGTFERNVEGWRDVWNFVDYTLKKIENTEFLKGIRVIKEVGIECGPISEQGALIDFYPYWFAYLKFTGEFAIAPTKEKYKHLL